MSNTFVFRERQDKRLEFVGDFEKLYKTDPDPWNQSGAEAGPMAQYYLWSRSRLLVTVQSHFHTFPTPFRGLEVGCGHGHVLSMLSDLTGPSKWVGMDVSRTAINAARTLFPKRQFVVGDIRKPIEGSFSFDVIVLGQLLWYVLDDLSYVIDNCYSALNDGGLLIISQALLREQRYGKEVIDGFYGLLDLFLKNPFCANRFRVIDLRYDDTNKYIHHDGILGLRKM